MKLDTTTVALGHLIKWMYTGNLVLLPQGSKTLDQFLPGAIEFRELAHFVMLTEALAQPLSNVKFALIQHRKSLTNRHIRHVLKLPQNDELRNMFAQACVKPYIENMHVFVLEKRKRHLFRHSEMLQVEGFAADLFKAFDETMQNGLRENRDGTQYVRDPLTQDHIEIS